MCISCKNLWSLLKIGAKITEAILANIILLSGFAHRLGFLVAGRFFLLEDEGFMAPLTEF